MTSLIRTVVDGLVHSSMTVLATTCDRMANALCPRDTADQARALALQTALRDAAANAAPDSPTTDAAHTTGPIYGRGMPKHTCSAQQNANPTAHTCRLHTAT
jgi:hypothetical protein